MPLYEYRCQQCHKCFEFLQNINSEPLAICPECGGFLHRLLSSPAIQFKGSGWYITDYARKNSPAGGNGRNSNLQSRKESKKDDRPATAGEDGSPGK